MDGGWGWGCKFADFNNDGLLDICALNGFVTGDPNQNYWYQIQEMVTQTKNQTVDAADWPPMGTRDLSGHEHTDGARCSVLTTTRNAVAASTASPSYGALPRFRRTTPDRSGESWMAACDCRKKGAES